MILLLIAIVVGALAGAAASGAGGALAGALFGWLIVRSLRQQREIEVVAQACRCASCGVGGRARRSGAELSGPRPHPTVAPARHPSGRRSLSQRVPSG